MVASAWMEGVMTYEQYLTKWLELAPEGVLPRSPAHIHFDEFERQWRKYLASIVAHICESDNLSNGYDPSKYILAVYIPLQDSDRMVRRTFRSIRDIRLLTDEPPSLNLIHRPLWTWLSREERYERFLPGFVESPHNKGWHSFYGVSRQLSGTSLGPNQFLRYINIIHFPPGYQMSDQ
jgi:hypothetical protein